MNYTTAVMLINPNIRAIKTTYEPDFTDARGVLQKKERKIYKTLDTSIKKGDLVIVSTDTRHKRTVVMVDEVDVEIDFESETEIGWIIDKVEPANHERVLMEEGKWIEQIKAAEKRRKREELKKSMIDMYQDSGIDKLPIAHMMDAASAAAIENKSE